MISTKNRQSQIQRTAILETQNKVSTPEIVKNSTKKNISWMNAFSLKEELKRQELWYKRLWRTYTTF
jgi:hypothetical protein